MGLPHDILFIREKEKKSYFFFVICRLIRIFAHIRMYIITKNHKVMKMKEKRMMTLAAGLLLMGASAMAQSWEWKSYSYVEGQGGLQLTSTDAPMDKLLTPTVALSVGHYFTPVVGARLHVNAWQSKSGFSDLDKYYKWYYFTPNVDVMFNISNLLSKNQSRPINLILLGGVGLNYSWDNDELKDLNVNSQRVPLMWDNNRLSHNLRAGLRLETNQSKPIGVSLEVNANSLSDRFNSKTNNSDDWQFTAMLGVNVRFGYKKYAPTVKLVNYTEIIEVEEPTVVKVKEKRPVEKMEHKNIKETVFYKIRESDANEAEGINQAIKKIADLMKTSEDATYTITGYADKGTGTPALNKKFAKQRADSMKDKLVNEHGIDGTRIKTDSKGDTVQPFEENDKNRCVIVTGEGTFKVTEYEEVEVEKTVNKKVKKEVTRQKEVQE